MRKKHKFPTNPGTGNVTALCPVTSEPAPAFIHQNHNSLNWQRALHGMFKTPGSNSILISKKFIGTFHIEPVPFWNAIKSMQLLLSPNHLNLGDCRIGMFASDFCKGCYQSHRGSLKEYWFANGKSPDQIKTWRYQKKSQIQIQFECDSETWHCRWMSLPLDIFSIRAESDEQMGMAGCANFIINTFFFLSFFFPRHMNPAHVLPLCVHTYSSFVQVCT